MDKTTLLSEARYAERLCQRTVRLYRHLQAFWIFVSVVGGSGLVASALGNAPTWVPVAGGVMLAIVGAINLATRPADKAAIAEADGKRYSQLRTAAQTMDETALQSALNKLRESDTPEVELLREVAYNDMVCEIGRPDAAVPLGAHQRLLSALA